MSKESVLSIPERFDFSYHKTFTEEYQQLLTQPGLKKVTLNFAKVQYLDSSALGMMVLFQKKASAKDIDVVIKNAQTNAKDILRIANFDRLFTIE